jgi:glycosyltransferase involved in cell wall biosynthesis
MQQVVEIQESSDAVRPALLPVSVIVPVRNEARNLPRCLDELRNVGEVYVVDSQSTDNTLEIACSRGAKVVQFHYQGGWPKKRQWAMDTLPLAYDWVLLLDADDPSLSGYWIQLQMYFLGRPLRFSGASFWKLSLFRRGTGRFECRLRDQDSSMADMEVHEHVIVDGPVARLTHPLVHHNIESLARYIDKHNEYSNWEAKVWLEGQTDELPPSLFANQAQRRRWLKKMFLRFPGSPLVLFFYRYFLRLGFLDGVPGLIYCGLQAIQLFHVKAKMLEARMGKG